MDFLNLPQRHFENYGFVVVYPEIDQPFTDRLKKAQDKINYCLNYCFPDVSHDAKNYPKNKEDALPWIHAKSSIQSHPDILGLIDPSIMKLLKNVLKKDIQPIRSSQIAVRFPGENEENPFASIHLDNFTKKDRLERPKIPGEFDLLVGILLEDNLEKDHGNFTLYPGSHHQIRAYLTKKLGGVVVAQSKDAYKYLCNNGFEEMFEELKFSNPYQVCGKAGSIILVDRMCAHLISAQNLSTTYARKIVWFRIKSVGIGYDHLIRQTGAGTHSLTLDLLGKFRLTQLIDLEIEGRCYLDTMDTSVSTDLTKMTIYAKPNMKIHQPNMFGSMVQLKVTPISNGTYFLDSVHTCGFLSKTAHAKWLEELRLLPDLTTIVQTINQTDYNELIKSWFVKTNQNTNLDPRKTSTGKITFHHLHSLSKTRMMEEWAKIFQLEICIVRGEPGKVTVTGCMSSIFEFYDHGVWRLHWSKLPEFVIG